MSHRTTGIIALAAGIAATCGGSASAIIAPYGSLPASQHGHVAWLGGGSAVPIGSNLLLTAKHVSSYAGQSMYMDGKIYKVSGVVDHPFADLSLVSVNGEMSQWHDIDFDAAPGETVVLGGTGVMGKRKSKKFFDWTSTRREQWAQNSIDSETAQYLTFDLDKKKKGVKFEAIVTPGDSGSGVFTQSFDGTLSLAGITVAVSGPENAATIGSIGYAVNLATYKGFILSAAAQTGFEGVIGGLNVTPVPAPAAALGLGGMLVPLTLRRRRSTG